MRFDLISIFPDYFAPLGLSLLGKAQARDEVSVEVHDLRDWATGKHRNVDDTPSGGGAGMVMRADVWGEAIDDVLSDKGRTVLAIPTPSGKPLTQSDLLDLTSADQIVVACGRYEGIDARVAQHYRGRPNVEVMEFSLGDYVLNGGEVAALALVEGVGRLVDGVVGNPESLDEESHADGLLEYPVYTAPTSWRGHEVPKVLKSGDHARIARWRRSESLTRTAQVRPDMVEQLDATSLSTVDLEALAGAGITVVPQSGLVSFRTLGEGVGKDLSEVRAQDLAAVSLLATQTFPLACPVGVTDQEISEFAQENLTAAAFAQQLERGARIGLAEVDGELVAYTLIWPSVPTGALGDTPIPDDCLYVSKCYAREDWQGSGVAGALLEWALKGGVEAWGSHNAALGTNRQNRRAAKFYRRHGFQKAGKRIFRVGKTDHKDDVFVRDLTAFPPS